MPNESTRTVLVALATGVGVTLTKVGAAVFTGSSAMAAEASHSLADTANDLFLLVADRRSAHDPDDRHPLGYGREAYFWALLAAIGVFIAGAAFSLREGINELIRPGVTSSFAVAYVVLAISAALDFISLRRSGGQVTVRTRREKERVAGQPSEAPGQSADRKDTRAIGRVHLGPVHDPLGPAHDPDDARIELRTDREELELQDLLNYSVITSDPTLRGVFTEDVVAVLGDGIAFAGLALNQITGSSLAQGVAAVLIGVLLIRVSLPLIRRSHDFLLGQPIQRVDEERVRAFLLAYPGVRSIRELIVTFVGPGQVWVITRLDVDRDLSGDQLLSLVRGIESDLMHWSGNVYRVDVVPTSGAQVMP